MSDHTVGDLAGQPRHAAAKRAEPDRQLAPYRRRRRLEAREVGVEELTAEGLEALVCMRDDVPDRGHALAQMRHGARHVDAEVAARDPARARAEPQHEATVRDAIEVEGRKG